MDALATVTPKPGVTITLRRACRADVAELVALITSDPVAQTRGDIPDQDIAPYLDAFDAIDADPSELLVTADRNGAVVGTFQLSFLPGLARRGATRAQIEAVRVREDHRGMGVGEAMLRWTIAEAQHCGCALVQLTSDQRRVDAHRFYERLGFVATHVGYKLELDPAQRPR
ncbi:GNAT family N-acetyltransferase [Mycolicibacterium conceptionense]|uniref:GNAT family N-acetyltransferase n=1 Tax=Mycolicibacterium conceptionense TaxID=451644 RepID=UPI001F25D377|nr:GNAT family N-acetyltransferase [Mycolicibacterium conceptionense]